MARFIPLPAYREYPEEEMCRRAAEISDELRRRRTTRDFSARPVPRRMLEACLLAAGSAPSGANRQPWHFVAVSNPDVKRQIREAAEIEEAAFYRERAAPEWLAALEPLGTDSRKPFLETAPWLIAVFAESYAVTAAGVKAKNYYVTESIGIATGLLIATLHHAGLVCLTHTPSPMGFLNRLLARPPRERPFLLLVVGYPADSAVVPDIQRKPLADIATFLD